VDEANSKSCGPFLDEITSEEEQRHYKSCFEDFCAAVQLVCSSSLHVTYISPLPTDATVVTVADHECRDLTRFLTPLGEGSALSCCLSATIENSTEGAKLYSIIVSLVQAHNDLIVASAAAARERQKRLFSFRPDPVPYFVSSHLMTRTNAFHCDPAKFVAFVEKQCVLLGGSLFDFDKAEAWLIDRHISGLPSIQLTETEFKYTGLQTGTLTILRERMKQVNLSEDAEKRIIDSKKMGDLDVTKNAKIVKRIEEVIAVLSSTSIDVSDASNGTQSEFEASAGEISLGEYIAKVLCDEPIGNQAVGNVPLNQVIGLLNLLKHSTDMFGGCSGKFKAALPAEVAVKLEQALLLVDKDGTRLPVSVVLEAMRSFVGDGRLNGDSTSSTCVLRDYIGFVPVPGFDELNDMPGFQLFPRSVTMAHFVETFKLLSDLTD